jgi:hypothetical protein
MTFTYGKPTSGADLPVAYNVGYGHYLNNAIKFYGKPCSYLRIWCALRRSRLESSRERQGFAALTLRAAVLDALGCA